ncbi:MAG: TrkH family potassium uptake protein [Oscillospiraceae bacterium]|jgi:trk system potassium uptake protein TrkH|nr:TrkH family potassium uptake protein [Oscillospiraceae bacterium]
MLFLKNLHRRFRRGSYYAKMPLLVAPLIAAPLLVLPFYPEDAVYAPHFIVPALVTALLGVALTFLTQDREKPSTEWTSPLRRGSVPVLYAWGAAILAGALPFVLAGKLDFIHALFESVSGWTTTGMTVVAAEELPKIFLFHRAFMQYSGGLGFIIIVSIVIQGRQTAAMYNAEGHPDGLMPNLRKTSRAIIYIYVSCLILGTALYAIFGMPFFDAVCHTMSALSTAGFSTRANSIGAYASVPIELVSIVLMLIGSMNFAVLLLLARGKLRRFTQVTEVRFLGGMLVIFISLTTLSLVTQYGMSILEGLREAAFFVVTSYSTTGYSTANYALWPQFIIGLLLLLMVLGGSTGSTAGGIKLLRAYVLIRVTVENIRRRLAPNHYVSVMRYTRPQGTAPIENSMILNTLEFVFCYFAIVVVGTLLMTLTAGCSLMDALYEFSSAFGTVGLSNGVTAAANSGTLVIEMIGMLLGRLEIFIVFIGLHAVAHSVRRAVQSRGAR